MKTYLIFRYQLLLAAFAVIFGVLSCEKENEELTESNSELEFAISISNLESTSDLKSSMDSYTLDEADKVLLTIQNSDGSPTKYTLVELKIQKMNLLYFFM